MTLGLMGKTIGGMAVLVVLAGCGGGDDGTGLFGQTRAERIANQTNPAKEAAAERRTRGSVFDLFATTDDPNVTVDVNRYLWNASLDILSFMPIEAADPFSGVIQFGYGTPPGSRQSYQATVFITDPALDARSLNLALRTRSGAVNADVQRQIEDAIMTRARQLRIADGDL
jgi:hypothetical protein